jgi:hypothetical protein
MTIINSGNPEDGGVQTVPSEVQEHVDQPKTLENRFLDAGKLNVNNILDRVIASNKSNLSAAQVKEKIDEYARGKITLGELPDLNLLDGRTKLAEHVQEMLLLQANHLIQQNSEFLHKFNLAGQTSGKSGTYRWGDLEFGSSYYHVYLDCDTGLLQDFKGSHELPHPSRHKKIELVYADGINSGVVINSQIIGIRKPLASDTAGKPRSMRERTIDQFIVLQAANDANKTRAKAVEDSLGISPLSAGDDQGLQLV